MYDQDDYNDDLYDRVKDEALDVSSYEEAVEYARRYPTMQRFVRNWLKKGE